VIAIGLRRVRHHWGRGKAADCGEQNHFPTARRIIEHARESISSKARESDIEAVMSRPHAGNMAAEIFIPGALHGHRRREEHRLHHEGNLMDAAYIDGIGKTPPRCRAAAPPSSQCQCHQPSRLATTQPTPSMQRSGSDACCAGLERAICGGLWRKRDNVIIRVLIR